MKRRSTQNVDNIDLQIIRILQEDSRSNYRDIANKLRIASGTVFNRIRRLEETGVLKCFTILVDPEKIGYGLTAVILIEAHGKSLIEFEEEIVSMSNVVSVYKITGDYNIAITARFRDRHALDEFVSDLMVMPFITRTAANIALNVIKEDSRINRANKPF
ncbi:MAG: hypothetical protein QG670_2024 [Thermoproteota archaeon]|nr:hypothetical protein [Thermoproteota archaeon]